MPKTPNRPPLSPAAQAVMMAATNGNINVVNDPVYRHYISAALRAAADRVVPREKINKDPLWHSQAAKQRQDTRAYLLAIAAELEGTND